MNKRHNNVIATRRTSGIDLYESFCDKNDLVPADYMLAAFTGLTRNAFWHGRRRLQAKGWEFVKVKGFPLYRVTKRGANEVDQPDMAVTEDAKQRDDMLRQGLIDERIAEEREAARAAAKEAVTRLQDELAQQKARYASIEAALATLLKGE